MAAMGGAGLMASFKSGETQPLQVAAAVRTGVVAAMMAAGGQAGVFAHSRGRISAYLGSQPKVAIEQPLAYGYALHGCYLKAYPGCRHMHASLDAMAEVLGKTSITAAEIEAIRVRTYKVAIETEIHTLNSRGDAYFDLSYAIAARVVLGRNDWDSFDEKHFADTNLLQIMKKVETLVDPEVEARYPHQRGSIVEVHTVDGKVHSAQVSFALGEPENPLPPAMIREKLGRASEGFFRRG